MADLTISPLAPTGGFPKLPAIEGVQFAAVAAGVKYRDRTDVMLAVCRPGSSVAGVFTRSATRAAPVLDCQDKLAGPIQTDAGAAIIVNSGNANAFTGSNGREAVSAVTRQVAKELGLPETRVFSASTGVIGEPLPSGRITDKISELAQSLDANGIEGAAEAIRTTDTFAKGAGAQLEIDGKTVSIAGISKGSGMIQPDMATMLSYVFTDAQVSPERLQSLLSEITDRTFNCITVDSDTSTSDSLMAVATGASGANAETDPAFAEALEGVIRELAHLVVRDGEGATKFITVNVTGAASEADGRKIGLSIANSPLVKTAIAGEDPNWGRVVMAVGKSGGQADRDKLSIWFGDVLVAENGWVAESYTEEAGAAHMTGDLIDITVDVGVGSASATVWTCDLTHGYITINADYRS